MTELPKWSRHDGPHEKLGNAWPPPEHMLPRHRIKPGRVVVNGEETTLTARPDIADLTEGTHTIETTEGPITVTVVDGIVAVDPVD